MSMETIPFRNVVKLARGFDRAVFVSRRMDAADHHFDAFFRLPRDLRNKAFDVAMECMPAEPYAPLFVRLSEFKSSRLFG